jgi:hypothetical protein
MRVRKAKGDGGGTSFADYVWKPVVLIETKKCGVDLSKHYRQAFDYWTRLVPGRPRSCGRSQSWVSRLEFKRSPVAVVDQFHPFSDQGF